MSLKNSPPDETWVAEPTGARPCLQGTTWFPNVRCLRREAASVARPRAARRGRPRADGVSRAVQPPRARALLPDRAKGCPATHRGGGVQEGDRTNDSSSNGRPTMVPGWAQGAIDHPRFASV